MTTLENETMIVTAITAMILVTATRSLLQIKVIMRISTVVVSTRYLLLNHQPN